MMIEKEIMAVNGGHYGYAEGPGNQVISDGEAIVMGAVITAAVASNPVGAAFITFCGFIASVL